MNFMTSAPSASLSGIVKQYWAMEACHDSSEGHVQRIIPTGLSDLIFYKSSTPKCSDSKRDYIGNIVVSGQQSSYYDLLICGELSLFAIILTPAGFTRLTGIPASELRDNSVPLNYLLPEISSKLEDLLFEADTFEEMVKVAESIFLSVLQKESLGYASQFDFKRMSSPIKSMTMTFEDASLESISSAACMSKRHFERKFQDIVGLSPKQFIRVARFQKALDVKNKFPEITLAQLASECGFYDQSHMTSEFKKFSGYTPGEYFKICEPSSDLFN